MPVIQTRRIGQFEAAILHHNGEPCVAFRPVVPKTAGITWGVGLSKLHEYFDTRTAWPTAYCRQQIRRAIAEMGFDPGDKAAMHGLLDTGVPGHLAYWPEPLEDGSTRLWALAIVAAPPELGPVAHPFVAAKVGDLLVVGREVDPELRGPADFDTVAATAAALTRSAPVAVA